MKCDQRDKRLELKRKIKGDKVTYVLILQKRYRSPFDCRKAKKLDVNKGGLRVSFL